MSETYTKKVKQQHIFPIKPQGLIHTSSFPTLTVGEVLVALLVIADTTPTGVADNCKVLREENGDFLLE